MFTKPNRLKNGMFLLLAFLLLGSLPVSVANSSNGWTTPIPASGTEGTSYTPYLVADSLGTIHMVWLDWVDTLTHNPYIVYANKPSGDTWTSFSYLPGHPTMSDAAIAVGPDDTVHIVWSAAGDGTIFYISRTVNGEWSSIQEISPSTEGNAYPDVAVAPNGTVHVVWNYDNVFDPDNQGIYYAMKPAEGSWSTPIPVYQDRYAIYCLIETDIYNTAHLIISRYESDPEEVLHAYKIQDEAWSSATAFTFSPAIQGVEQLASDGQNNLYLVWREIDYTDCSLKYIRKSTTAEGGSWTGPFTAISGDCSSVYVEYPSITFDHQGHPCAVWSSRFWDDQEGEFVYSTWFSITTVGGSWGGGTLIADNMAYANTSSIAVDNTGNYHVVWDTGPQPAYPGEIYYSFREGPPEIPVTIVITPAGGSIKTNSDDIIVTFPPGFVTEDVVVTLTKTSSTPTGNLAGIIFFDLSAVTVSDGTPVTFFNLPYEITIDYGIDGPGPTFEETLKLYYWDGTQWQLEPTSALNIENHLITATLNHMTLFSVLGETQHIYLPLAVR